MLNYNIVSTDVKMEESKGIIAVPVANVYILYTYVLMSSNKSVNFYSYCAEWQPKVSWSALHNQEKT